MNCAGEEDVHSVECKVNREKRTEPMVERRRKREETGEGEEAKWEVERGWRRKESGPGTRVIGEGKEENSLMKNRLGMDPSGIQCSVCHKVGIRDRRINGLRTVVDLFA